MAKMIRRCTMLVLLLLLTAGLSLPAWAAGGQAQAPELSMWDPTSVVVKAVEGQEYVIALKGADPDWSKTVAPADGFVTFDNLTPATAYVIYTRIQADAGEPQTLAHTTDLIGLGVWSENDFIPGAVLNLQPDPEDAKGLTYQWYYDTVTVNEEGGELHDLTPIEGAAGLTYTIQEADLGKSLAVKVFKDEAEVGEMTGLGPVAEAGAADTDEDEVCPQDDTCPISQFQDATPTAWYHDGVHWALANGVMNGVGSGKFAPNGVATRAMVVTMLWRIEGEPAAGTDAAFADVEKGSWYQQAVNWAAKNKVVNGTGDATFSPNASITREQIVAILYRYLQFKGVELSIDANILDYDDALSISSWAVEAFRWAVQEGIVQGVGNNRLSPAANATRAQIATMLQRFCDALEQGGVTPINPPADEEGAEAAVDYGTSELYTQEEMDAAIERIHGEFDKWTGCQLHSVRYAGDECNSAENIKWLNSLKEGKNYTQCIEFLTDFHSPKDESDLEGTAWEPDHEYKDYQWWLARAEGGDWELVSWGY
ncbi:MAG: S-layer homology domain-containing protein [Firmicutes bacterium]|nr:S-layer homology domain-containing protein [Bacillota bacterium]